MDGEQKAPELRLLPRSQWTFHKMRDDRIAVGAYVNEAFGIPGWRHYVLMSELPNDFVSLEDLERVLADHRNPR